MGKRLCLCALSIAAAAAVAMAVDHPDLTGTWQSKSEAPNFQQMEIQQKDGSIQITDATDPSGKEKKFDIRCNTVGKECKLKDEQVSMWFNGPMLVLMETRRGNEVVIKKRLSLSEDGKTLTMEVQHIAPPGDKESFTFTRQDSMKANR